MCTIHENWRLAIGSLCKIDRTNLDCLKDNSLFDKIVCPEPEKNINCYTNNCVRCKDGALLKKMLDNMAEETSNMVVN